PPAAPIAAPPGDSRIRIRYGSPAGTEPLVLTPQGAQAAFTSSFSLSDERFVPDPYVGRCSLVAVKYTMKTEDQKSVLGDQYRAPEPDTDDPLVLHPTELRNAAGRFGANSVYLLLNGSEDLPAGRAMRDCSILSKVGNRDRGEALNEIACRGDGGKLFKFSQYGGRASLYACSPSGGRPSRKKGTLRHP
ncbi:MAG: hypothetical protein ACM3L8_01210, partial [Verrucomicrobiota bacterium]